MDENLNDATAARRDREDVADEGAQDRLRRELLASGLEDWVSMAEVQQLVSHLGLADAAPARQELVLRTIRSVVEDGLMAVGDLPGADGHFPAWDGDVDTVMRRLSDRFVDHYEDPADWDYSIWLGLTSAGERVARAMMSAE